MTFVIGGRLTTLALQRPVEGAGGGAAELEADGVVVASSVIGGKKGASPGCLCLMPLAHLRAGVDGAAAASPSEG